MRIPLTDDDGLFWGPVEAAYHATYVQGGFSTPAREAARMLLDGGTGAERARAWMSEQHLALEDLDWDPGQLIAYRLTGPRSDGRILPDGPPDGNSPVTGIAWNE